MKNYFLRELFIIRCFFRLLQRDFKKYFTVGGITYWLGASGLYPSAKPTYFFCRYVDDLADGDRKLPRGYKNFESFVQRMKTLVETGNTGDLTNIERVLADAVNKLCRKSANHTVIKQELSDFLDSMLIDYNRRIHTTVLTQSELDRLYDRSFSAVLQLTFIGTGTELDRAHITRLGLIQGKLYGLQDLHEDLVSGIINLPQELISATGMSLKQITAAPASLEQNEAFQQWRSDELTICYDYLQALQSLDADKKVKKIISILTDPLAVYLKQEMAMLNKPDLQLS
ncbi:MAG: hypothetical protein Roseis2KO_41300 [Roseivirga sp.]